MDAGAFDVNTSDEESILGDVLMAETPKYDEDLENEILKDPEEAPPGLGHSSELVPPGNQNVFEQRGRDPNGPDQADKAGDTRRRSKRAAAEQPTNGSNAAQVAARESVKNALAVAAFREGLPAKTTVQLAKTVLNCKAKCYAKECSDGVSLGEALAFAPPDIKAIKFHRVEELARAISFWSAARTMEDEAMLRQNPFKLQTTPTDEDVKLALRLLTKACTHRQAVIQETGFLPLCNLTTANLALCDKYTSAVGDLRAEMRRTVGKVTQEIFVVGGQNAEILAQTIMGAQWVPVAHNKDTQMLAFQNWTQVANDWDVSGETHTGIILLEASTKVDEIANLVKAAERHSDLLIVIVAPPSCAASDSQLSAFRKDFLRLKKDLESDQTMFVGWRDGPDKINVVNVIGGVPFDWRPACVRADGTMTQKGASVMVAALNYIANTHLVERGNMHTKVHTESQQHTQYIGTQSHRGYGGRARLGNAARGRAWSGPPRGMHGRSETQHSHRSDNTNHSGTGASAGGRGWRGRGRSRWHGRRQDF